MFLLFFCVCESDSLSVADGTVTKAISDLKSKYIFLFKQPQVLCVCCWLSRAPVYMCFDRCSIQKSSDLPATSINRQREACMCPSEKGRQLYILPLACELKATLCHVCRRKWTGKRKGLRNYCFCISWCYSALPASHQILCLVEPCALWNMWQEILITYLFT